MKVMPNRMLRDYTLSDKVDALSFQAECLFIRLMTQADDYGSFYGNAKIIKAKCFPLRIDTIRDADITRWLHELQTSGLIVVYNNAAKPYLRIIDFNQRLRTKTNKFPEPPTHDSNMRTDDSSPPPEEKRREVEEKANSAPDYLTVEMTFINQGGTKEMAKAFFDKHNSTNWHLNGSKIVSWPSLIGNFIKIWKQNEVKNSNGKYSEPVKRYQL